MQNKPNFRKSQMNVNTYNTTEYENKRNWTIGQNKPNSNPIFVDSCWSLSRTEFIPHGVYPARSLSRTEFIPHFDAGMGGCGDAVQE
jgi:hypothetical protein